jgi:hypothetical protein
MRDPASAFENRTHGAEKIGPSRYSDFFNRIGQKQKFAVQNLMSVLPQKRTLATSLWVHALNSRTRPHLS